MPEYGAYPLGTLAAGCSKTKKEYPGPQAAWDGCRYAGRATLWATPTSPSPCLHRDGRTALHFAASSGHLATVRALINAGASLHIQTNEYMGFTDYDSMSGRWAFCGGRRGRLVRSGWASAVAAAAAARRFTPLHMAAMTEHADVTAALLGAGADACIKSEWMYAAAGKEDGSASDGHKLSIR
jgi:hypothetical protein